MALDVISLRRETPGCAARIHLDNAGAAFSPAPVLRAIHGHLELEQSVGGYEAARQARDAIDAAYAAVGRLIGCGPRNVAFLDSATGAYARVLSAIPLERGDVILTTSNDYVSNQLMFLSLARRIGVRIVRARNAPDGPVDLDDIEDKIRTLRPRLVSVTHVPTNSGLVQPIEKIGRMCRAAEIPYLVDACQSVGQLPLDVARIGCDFLAASARKFLRGPRGIGFLHASDRALESRMEPLFPDMRGAAWTGPDTSTLAGDARRFEYWEQPYALLLGTGAAAEYALALGVDAIAERIRGLSAALRNGLQSLGLPVLDRGGALAGIVTTSIDGADPESCQASFRERGIIVSISTRAYAAIDFGEKGVEWAIRLSPHCYNTEEEVAATLETIREIRSKARAGTPGTPAGR